MAAVGRPIWLLALLPLLAVPAAVSNSTNSASGTPSALTPRWGLGVNLDRTSCVVRTSYEDGLNFSVGLDRVRSEPAYYLMFIGATWDYQVDGTYAVNVSFDSASTWAGKGVGVVVAKSNTKTVDKDYVEVIQNANFAIKAEVAKALLDKFGVPYEVEPPGEDPKTPDVADIARAFSAQVICEVTQWRDAKA